MKRRTFFGCCAAMLAAPFAWRRRKPDDWIVPDVGCVDPYARISWSDRPPWESGGYVRSCIAPCKRSNPGRFTYTMPPGIPDGAWARICIFDGPNGHKPVVEWTIRYEAAA